MSLFVKGAKLPKIEGDKSIKAEIQCVGGKWEFGIMTGGYYCSQEWTFYPLSELPPHGRLIEKGVLLDNCYQHYEDFMLGKVDGKTALLNIEKEIKAAPVIVEAEEGE